MCSVIFELTSHQRCYLERAMHGEAALVYAAPLVDISQLPSVVDDIDILCVCVRSRITAQIMDALPQLRMIVTRSNGYGHIDVKAASKRGVVVCNIPAFGDNTVAEHTFALILSLSRKIHQAIMRTSRGDFSVAGLQGFDLKGRTIGIVGTGQIGLQVASIAKAFEMEVLATDPNPRPEITKSIGFSYTTIEDLLQRSDIVTLHAPLLESTRKLMNCRTLRNMKEGSLLINTARGELVDTCDLLAALDDGHIAGAGLDVLEGEENLSEDMLEHPSESASKESLQLTLRNLALLRRPDLIVTPHIAYDSKESNERTLDATWDVIRAFREGKPKDAVPSAQRFD